MRQTTRYATDARHSYYSHDPAPTLAGTVATVLLLFLALLAISYPVVVAGVLGSLGLVSLVARSG